MEDKLSYKANAIELLEKQLSLRAKKGQYGFIVLSSATDPYLQFEQEYQLTRSLLELILKYRFPVHIITKSDLVIRDLDLLAEIDRQAILPADLEQKSARKVFITFSFSTVDDQIAHIFEPGATAPSLRLNTLKTVVSEGFLSGVSMMPLLPYITDTGAHLEEMFASFKEAGAQYVFPSTITLFGKGPSDSKTLVMRAVDKYYPHLSLQYHQLFDNSTQLPAYYNAAFGRKAKELCEKYSLRDRIL
jgi:DNA repair photolyase